MAAIDISNAASGGGGGGGNLQLSGGASMTSTLTAVTDTSNTSSPLKLSTTAVQVTSPLRITTSDASGFYLDAEDSATNNRFSIKRDPSSQEVTLDFASNPSGSTSLVGAIRTYRDGTNLSNAMSFIEDGSVGIGTNAPVGILHLYKSAAATRLAIDGDAGQNRLISYRTGAVQRFGLYVNNTAESGSNAGSNFAIRAYSDAGTLLSTPFFVTRSSGNVGINTLTPSQKLHVVGSLRIESGGIYDGTNSIGTSGQVLSSTGTATAWITPATTSPAGTTGAVQFNNGGAFGADSANLFWDDTNDRLGIGTNTPSSYLQVSATWNSGNNRWLKLTEIGTGNTFGIVPAQVGLAISGYTFTVNDTNEIVGKIGQTLFGTNLTGGEMAARVGIRGNGSTSATTSLLVQNSSATQLINVRDDGRVIIGTTSANSGAIQFEFPNVGTNGVFWADGASNYGSITLSRGTGEMRIGTNTVSYFPTFYSNGSEKMRLLDGGLVIGGTSLNASAGLQVDSTTKGFLPPRMTTAQKLAIGTPAAGLQVYDSTLNQMSYYNGTTWINF